MASDHVLNLLAPYSKENGGPLEIEVSTFYFLVNNILMKRFLMQYSALPLLKEEEMSSSSIPAPPIRLCPLLVATSMLSLRIPPTGNATPSYSPGRVICYMAEERPIVWVM